MHHQPITHIHYALHLPFSYFFFFFFNHTPTTEIYTLSLHDALPICAAQHVRQAQVRVKAERHRHRRLVPGDERRDRKSTRLNSSHGYISYAVFCLKKKKTRKRDRRST